MRVDDTISSPTIGFASSSLRAFLHPHERGHDMAQKVKVLLIDDLDGSEADETISFAVDGVSYEIDLNSAHSAELRETFAQWIGHARKVGWRPSTPRPSAAATPPRSASGPARTATR